MDNGDIWQGLADHMDKLIKELKERGLPEYEILAMFILELIPVTTAKWGEEAELSSKEEAELYVKSNILKIAYETVKSNILKIAYETLTGPADETAAEEKQICRLPKIRTDTNDVVYPIDKVNNLAWGLMSEKNPTANFRTLPGCEDGTVTFCLSFDDLKNVSISRELTPFDKRLYIAVSSLYADSCGVMTLSQIHNKMGNKGRPSQTQIRRIQESLEKMMLTRISIDNTNEIENGGKFPEHKASYIATLLPLERIRVEANGRITDNAVHVFREPPLITWARERKQVTTIPQSLLASPISQSDMNLALQDYLIYQISLASKTKRILYDTIFERVHADTRKRKDTTKKNLESLCNYYMQQKFLKSYELDEKGVTFYK